MEDVTADLMEGNGMCDTIVSECLGVVSPGGEEGAQDPQPEKED
jgi:hypothetical protein